MKSFTFKIKTEYISHGTVEAEDREEAISLIENEDWDDLFDESYLGFDEGSIQIISEEEIED